MIGNAGLAIGRRKRRSPVALVCLALACLALAACVDSTVPGARNARDVLVHARTFAASTGAFRDVVLPAGTGGPTIAVHRSSGVIRGGSSIWTVTSETPFSVVFVGVAGLDGVWELALPDSVRTATVVITMAQDVPRNALDLEFAAGTSSSVGAARVETVTLTDAATGPVQVALSWNSSADVDLSLEDPDGEVIFFGHPVSESGGTLNLDSNSACGDDGVRTENISWPRGTPPSGGYVVRVNYWDACGSPFTEYVVTVWRDGQSPAIYTGTFSGPGNGGAEGAVRTVASFTY